MKKRCASLACSPHHVSSRAHIQCQDRTAVQARNRKASRQAGHLPQHSSPQAPVRLGGFGGISPGFSMAVHAFWAASMSGRIRHTFAALCRRYRSGAAVKENHASTTFVKSLGCCTTISVRVLGQKRGFSAPSHHAHQCIAHVCRNTPLGCRG